MATRPRTSDFEVLPNLQQSSSSVSKSRRKAHFPTGGNEKASSGGAGRGLVGHTRQTSVSELCGDSLTGTLNFSL